MRHDLEKIRSESSLIALLIRDGHQPKKSGDRFKSCCPFHSEKTPSFWVYQEPERFKCFGCGVSGSIFDYVMLRDNCDFSAALRTLGAVADLTAPSPRKKIQSKFHYLKPLPENMIHSNLYDDILAGQHRLVADLPAQDRIADSRGWSGEFVEWCAQSCRLVLMTINARTVVAFPVESPDGTIYGIHIRWPDPKDGAPKWTFEPSGTAAFPYQIGASKDSLDRVVICEGQWDALTLAYAWGWHKTSDNQGITIIGVRGAQGIRPVLDHYTFADNAKIILCPDNDKAGESWFKRDGFADQLRQRGSVTRWRIEGGKDINESFIAGKLDHQEMLKEILC